MFPYFNKVVELSFGEGNKRANHVHIYCLTICTTWQIKSSTKIYTKVTGICNWLDRHAISVSELVGPNLCLPLNGPLIQTVWRYFWTSGSTTVCSVWTLAVAIDAPPVTTDFDENKIFLPTREISWHGFCFLTLERLHVLYNVWIKMRNIYRF